MSIGGRPASADQVRADVSAASAAWLRDRRGEKTASTKRRHRARSEAEKEAKALATAQAKKNRQAEREARELERLLARIGYLSRRSAREAESMLRVRVSWKPSAEPKVTSVCPRALYSRLHPEISSRTTAAMTRSRIAADGFKNIVLRKIPRGYGRKVEGTRPYRHGEAADLFLGVLVRMHHAGVAAQGVVGRVAARGVGETGDGAVGSLGHEGLADFGDFFRRDEAADGEEAVALELGRLDFV